MRNPNRIKPVLAAIEAYWMQNPDLRLGQIVCNAAGGDPFYTEDSALVAGLAKNAPQKKKDYLKELRVIQAECDTDCERAKFLAEDVIAELLTELGYGDVAEEFRKMPLY